MKKILSILASLAGLFFVQNSYAQVYVKISSGYNFEFNGNTKSSSSNSTVKADKSGTEGSYNYQYHSLGQGFNLDGSIGYNMGNISYELGVSYFQSNPISSHSYREYLHLNIDGNYFITKSEGDYATQAQMIRLNPSLILNMGSNALKPYARIGMIIGFGEIVNNMYSNSDDIKIGTTRIITRDYGSIALGINSSLGISYSISDKLSLFSEATFTNINYSPAKREYINWESTVAVNGYYNPYWRLYTNDGRIIYKDEYTLDAYEYTGKDEIGEYDIVQKSFSNSFNSIGINIGIKYSFK